MNKKSVYLSPAVKGLAIRIKLVSLFPLLNLGMVYFVGLAAACGAYSVTDKMRRLS